MKQAQWMALVFGVMMLSSRLQAQEVSHYEKDGIRYQKIRQVNQRPITELRYEQRESTAYRERYTTDLQETQRAYQVPITEQQWVPGYQRTWNVFAPPVLSYRLMPVTRWETRVETVRVPITRRDVVPERTTQQVPVYNTRYAEEVTERHVAVGTVSNGTPSVARSDSSSGGHLDGDPPREGTTDLRGGLEMRR